MFVFGFWELAPYSLAHIKENTPRDSLQIGVDSEHVCLVVTTKFIPKDNVRSLLQVRPQWAADPHSVSLHVRAETV